MANPQSVPKFMSPADIRSLETFLGTVKRALDQMGSNNRRESQEYKDLLAKYQPLFQKLTLLEQRQAARAQAARSVPVAPAAVYGAPKRPGSGSKPATLPATVPPGSPLPRPAAPPPVAGLPLSLPKFVSSLGPAQESDEVEHLQQLLSHLGYQVAPSGEFDAETGRAVQAFQRDRALNVTGTVGLQMRQVLNEMVMG